MATFDTNQNTVTDAQLSAKSSLYAPDLEAVAPNITTLIDDVRTTGESWVSALQRSMPFLILTEQQKTQLAALIDRAANNLPPLNIASPSEQIRTFVLYGSLALFVYKLWNLGK